MPELSLATPGTRSLFQPLERTHALVPAFFYWQVQARDQAGNTTPFSDSTWFVVDVTAPGTSSGKRTAEADDQKMAPSLLSRTACKAAAACWPPSCWRATPTCRRVPFPRRPSPT